MNKKIMILMIGIFLLMPFITAENIGIFKQNSEMQITNYCSTSDCTYANLTRIILPNGTINTINEEMTQTGYDFNYSYTPTELGTYKFTTCSNPSGVNVCEEDTFEITPSGNSGSNNIFFYIIILVLGYTLNLLGFFNRNSTITILGGIVLIFVGLFILQNGIIVFRDNLTLVISYITLFWGVGSALWAAVSEIEDNF